MATLIDRYRVEPGPRSAVIITDRLTGQTDTLTSADGGPHDTVVELVAAYCARHQIQSLEVDPTGLGLPLAQGLNEWGMIQVTLRRSNGEPATLADREAVDAHRRGSVVW